MTVIIRLQDIQTSIVDIDLIAAMEQAFIQYSNGNSVVPPVGELLFDEPKGDTHIKYGYIKQQDFYVVKIASGFYGNPALSLSSSQGLMLLFSQKTGAPEAILLDEGFLTDLRTAAAGALAAKYFAPANISGYGIIGTGIQAQQQVLQLVRLYQNSATPCQTIWLWGRNNEQANKLARTLRQQLSDDFKIHVASSAAQVAANANLIVTTTPSEAALLTASDIQPGTHITAVGADTEHKQELDSQILAKADIVISDSIEQCQSRGEIYRAMQNSAISLEQIVELGTAIQNPTLQRINEQQISVVDLTGVAVQDIMIASAVYNALQKNSAED